MPGMRDSATLTCAVPGGTASTSRSTVSSRAGLERGGGVAAAVGVCAARTWMSQSRVTEKSPGPLTATATLPKPTSPAFSGHDQQLALVGVEVLVSATGRLERDRPVASSVTL